MGYTKLLALLCIYLFSSTCETAAQTRTEPLTTIAFGSCARERKEQPVWQDILAQDPQLMLLIGDAMYADFWIKDGKMGMRPVPNVERIREAYDALGQKKGYQTLKQSCPIMATWDDHDYGANDMGNDFDLREESQQEFIRFYGFDDDHPINQRQGIYHSQIFGPQGKRTQIIMLDTRYHRDPLVPNENRPRGSGPYKATDDASTTVLGDVQWKWFEDQLKQDADVRIIASSIQVVADEHGWETWGNFPHERDRLYKLIESTGAGGVVFISGDRHVMEISCDDVRTNGYPIWDFTSSGLTQDSQKFEDANQFRVGPVKRELNFGIIKIQWSENRLQTRVHLEGYGTGGKLITRQTLRLAALQPKK